MLIILIILLKVEKLRKKPYKIKLVILIFENSEIGNRLIESSYYSPKNKRNSNVKCVQTRFTKVA